MTDDERGRAAAGDTVPDAEPDAELRRIEERITVLSNWLIQGRCGDDAECIAAKTLELRALQAQRDRLRGS